MIERILAPGSLGSSHQFATSFFWTLISQLRKNWGRKSVNVSSDTDKFMLFSRWQRFYAELTPLHLAP
jgi:hypothetical protein